MDYSVMTGLSPFHGLLFILLSYDIACQWFVNFYRRMNHDWPEEYRMPDITFIPAIPKFHEPAHEGKGHKQFSLNFIRGVGNSDLEVAERLWGPHNVLGNATKTNGPGARHLLLEDHFQWWNFEKYVGMGFTLRRKYIAAVADRNKQEEGHRGFTESIPEELVEEWDALCHEWEKEGYPKSAENPFEVEEAGMSEAKVVKELEDYELERRRKGGAILHATSPHTFMMMGLQLEEDQ